MIPDKQDHGQCAGSAGNSRALLERLRARGHRYLLDDLDLRTQDKLYQQTYRSYIKGETGQSWTREQFFTKVRNGPWIFHGDKEFSGYISIRELRAIKGVAKLTGCAGSKRGMLAGLAKLNEDGIAIVGAVTPELYLVALKVGFRTIAPAILKIFIQLAPEEVWSHGGKPEVGDGGELIINMPELGKKVIKQFVCNEAFLRWTEQKAIPRPPILLSSNY